MQVVVLIGGFATRLYPLSYTTPKVFLPIANEMFIDRLINWFEENGVTDVVFAINNFASSISDYLEKIASENKINIKIKIETIPLGSGGALQNCRDLLDNNFILLNGDILTNLNLNKLLSFHNLSNSFVTATVSEVKETIHYGILDLIEGDRAIGWQEKPLPKDAKSNWGNVGAWVINSKILDYIPKNKFVSLEKEVFPILFKEKVPFYGYKFNGYWKDIGTIDKYKQANYDLISQENMNRLINGVEVEKGFWIEENVVLEKDIIIKPPVIIGKNNHIHSGSVLLGPTIIGADCKLGPNIKICGSILWDKTCVDNNTLIYNSVIASSIIGKECEINNNCVISLNSIINNETKLHCGTIIGPNSII